MYLHAHESTQILFQGKDLCLKKHIQDADRNFKSRFEILSDNIISVILAVIWFLNLIEV